MKDLTKNKLSKKIDNVLSENFCVDTAIEIMSGLSVMLQEFINGNSWPNELSIEDPAYRYFIGHLNDLLIMTARTLDLTAQNTKKEYLELEQKLFDAVYDASDEGGE